jgi:hypothetical protein
MPAAPMPHARPAGGERRKHALAPRARFFLPAGVTRAVCDERGHLVQEIEWSGMDDNNARWLIEASDLELRWIRAASTS